MLDFLLGNQLFQIIINLVQNQVMFQIHNKEKIDKLRFKDNPLIDGNLLKILKNEQNAKNIMKLVDQKKVQNEKYLKLSDFIEYLTDYYDCVENDPNMETLQIEQVKEQIMIMIIKLILNAQDDANYDSCMLLIVKNNMHHFIVEHISQKFESWIGDISFK